MVKIMKVLKRILFVLLVFILTSCTPGVPKEFKEAYKNDQFIPIDYKTYDEMISNGDSFVLFVRKDGCGECAKYYPLMAETLTRNLDYKVYAIDSSDLESTEAIVLTSMFYSTLGRDYYSENKLDQNLYTPSTALIVNGEFYKAYIGSLSSDEFEYYYQPSFLYFDTYYSYNRQIQIRNEVKIIFSNEEGNTYNNQMRDKYKNTNENIVFVNYNKFTDSQVNKLLNRVNYYLDENSQLDNLPNNFVLDYKNNAIVSYYEGKID